MYGLQVGKIVVFKVDTEDEKESSIAAVDNLKVAKLKKGEGVNVSGAKGYSHIKVTGYYDAGSCSAMKQAVSTYCHEIGVFGIPDGDNRVHFLDKLLLLVIIERHVPFRKACLASAVLNQDEANLHMHACACACVCV